VAGSGVELNPYRQGMPARRLSFGLPRAVWVVQVGVFLNTFGYGAVLPFEIIYLHSARHFSLAVAGLVIATVTGTAIVASFPAGSLVDYIGPRDSAAAGLVLLALGYGGLAFVTSVWEAFVCALVAGCGNGLVTPSQSTLVAALVPRELRPRATAVSRVSVNVGFASGAALGGLVAATGSTGLRALFLVNAATYLVYALLLRAAVHVAAAARDLPPGSYRRVFADRPFLTLAVAHVGFIAVGWGVFTWVVPVYALRVGVNSVLIGAVLLVNGLTVVIAQIPIANRLAGTRRSRSIALAGGAFVLACAVALVAQARVLAGAVLILVAVLVALGECLYIASFTPLVADMAPPEMLGRYMSCVAVAWSLGLAAATAVFIPLVGISASACFLAAAAVIIAATAAVLLNEKRLADDVLRTQVISRAS
jgi:MFS family permease